MQGKASSKKVLVAVRPKDLQLVLDALGHEFDLIVCHTVEEAAAHFGSGIGLIACGVRFDSGRMFDLLKAAKADPGTRSVPFYLVLGDKTYSKPILDGITTAAKALGIAGFVDLIMLERSLGKEKAYERLREAIRRYL